MVTTITAIAVALDLQGDTSSAKDKLARPRIDVLHAATTFPRRSWKDQGKRLEKDILWPSPLAYRKDGKDTSGYVMASFAP